MKRLTTPVIKNTKIYDGKKFSKVSMHTYKPDATSKGEKRKKQGKCSNYRVFKSRAGYVLYER